MGTQGRLTSVELQKLFSGGTIILFRCEASQDFPLTFVSDNCSEILGFDPSYFLTNLHGWSDRIHPDDRAAVLQNFLDVLECGGSAITEYRFRKGDGSLIWLRDELKFMRGENGGAPAILGSSIDITSRKNAEIELRESKERYQSVVDHIKDVVYHIDKNMNWSFLSKAWVEMTGYAVSDTLGRPFLEFVHPEDRTTCENIYNLLLNESNDDFASSRIIRVLKRSGGYVWVELNGRRTLGTAPGESMSVSGTLVNVTAELSKQKEVDELNHTLEKRVTQRSAELSREIEKRKKAQAVVRKRLTYEQTISRCSNILLESSEPDAVDKALALLQKVSSADRVYIFENYKGEDGALYMNQIHEACGEGVESQIANPDLQGVSYNDFSWWCDQLSQHKAINTIVDDLEQPERRILQSQNIKSVLALPVFIDQKWYGFIGFDNVHRKAIWGEDDIRLLKTVSEIIAAYKKRQHIQKSLIRQKNYTEAILNSLPSIYLAIDENLKPVHWNKNAENLTGYSREEIKKMSVFDLIVPEDHHKLTQEVSRLKQEEDIGSELRILTKEGEEADFFWRGRFIRLEDEQLLICVGLDITNQKETEQELMDEKRLSEAIIDCLPGIFYMLDEEGNYLKWNQNFVDQLGYTAEEIPGMNVADVFDGDEFTKVANEIQKVFTEGEADVEADIVTESGFKIPYYLTGKRFEQNGKQYLVGSGYNISEQRRTTEKLKRSEELFRNLFLKAPAAIVMVDADNRVMMINQSFEELFGYTEEEIIKKDLDKVIVPPEDYNYVPKMPAIDFKGSHYYHQAQRKAKNGVMKHVFVGSIPIYINGEPYVGFGMYIDITEQVEYENQISDSLKEKQVLLQEIHHRVKNNLAVISGLIQLQIYDVDDEYVQRTLQESQSRIQTMALIHEKLYQSQNLSRVSCRTYIEELIQTIYNTFKTDMLKVDIHTDIEDVELNINKAIPFALLINEVLSNAFEHAFPGYQQGTIRVKLHENDSRIHVDISDDGIGLPENYSVEENGTLGMTLIHNFLNQLEAEWELYSRNGTSLSLTFSKEYSKGSSTTMV